MKRGIILFLMNCAFLIGNAQENDAYWADLLLQEINELRNEQNLNEFRLDEILSAAAFDQAEYCSELGRLVHTQDNSKKETVAQRVLYYEGLHGAVEENLSQIAFGAKEALEPNGVRVEIDTDEKMVQAIVAAWLEDEKSSKLNLLDPNCRTIGVSVIITQEVDHLFCVVFGNEPYQALGNEKLNLKNYGIEEYDEQKCRKFKEDFPSVSALFSDVLKIKNEEVFFEYHSMGFVKQLLSDASDAIAIDWVDQMQYACGEGVQDFPGKIASGYLQRPTRKSFLLAQNLADSIGELNVKVGEVPSFYQRSITEPNLLIIKDGVHCATVPFNQIESNDTAQIPLEFAVAGAKEGYKYRWKDSLEFNIPLFPNGADLLQKAKEQLIKLNFNAATSATKVQVSPTEISRLEQLKDKYGEAIYIAWDSIDSFVKNTYYQLEMQDLTKEEKIAYLLEARKEDAKLNSFLESLNQIRYTANGEALLQLTKDTQKQLELYRFFLANHQINPALFVQSKLLNKVRSGVLNAKSLPQADPAQKTSTLDIINNQIVLESLMGATQYGGNPIYLALFELYLINRKEPEVAFNYHIAKIRYWSKNFSEAQNLEGWLSGFKKIPSERIERSKYARALVNYHLLAVDYFYEKDEFDKRKKSFTELMKWQKAAELNDTELLHLAKILCFQDQFSSAIELLKARIVSDEVREELLLYFIQIAQYDKEKVSEKDFLKALQKAQNLYPKQFCQLFTTCKMGKQSLKNSAVKTLYCSSCN